MADDEFQTALKVVEDDIIDRIKAVKKPELRRLLWALEVEARLKCPGCGHKALRADLERGKWLCWRCTKVIDQSDVDKVMPIPEELK